MGCGRGMVLGTELVLACHPLVSHVSGGIWQSVCFLIYYLLCAYHADTALGAPG